MDAEDNGILGGSVIPPSDMDPWTMEHAPFPEASRFARSLGKASKVDWLKVSTWTLAGTFGPAFWVPALLWLQHVLR
ncbi:hypothetical protein CCR94_16040 [Rhodoblastus sphagnicola]|uniref:Uncharacterized protein n=1 Tax=Rhodoblastus sphagnicola TaxID=333368 RepID=A0A2S6N3B5_9HYPH|nr:hypothetical protein CCR94_16040 [Rhodoblastus sphagnicola]